MAASNRTPTLITDDTDLGGFTTCATCNTGAAVADGPIVVFVQPTRIVCAKCVDAIKTATA